MRNLFPAYYKPSDEEFDQLWRSGVFVFDTNVLLKVYQLDKNLRTVLLSLFEQLAQQNRLWIPYQAAREYHKNIFPKILGQEALLDQAFTEKDGLVPLLKGVLTRAKIFETHPIVSHKELCGVVEDAIAKIEKLFDKGDQLTNYKKDCELLSLKMSQLFEGRVGNPYDEETLSKKRKEADDRYKSLVPPGYMDKKEKDKLWEGERTNPTGIIPGDPYGDALLWFQMLDFASADKRPIVFTTDDAKADWWYKVNGKRVGPRPELGTEMRQIAGVNFHMYDSAKLMEIAGDYFEFSDSNLNAAISESRRIADHSELLISAHPDTMVMLRNARRLMEARSLDSYIEIPRDLMASNLISQAEYADCWLALEYSHHPSAEATPYAIESVKRASMIFVRAYLMMLCPPPPGFVFESEFAPGSLGAKGAKNVEDSDDEDKWTSIPNIK